MSTTTSHAATFSAVPVAAAAAATVAAGAVVIAGLAAAGVVAGAAWVGSKLVEAFAIPEPVPTDLAPAAVVSWVRQRNAELSQSPVMGALTRIDAHGVQRTHALLQRAEAALSAGDPIRAGQLALLAYSSQRAVARTALKRVRSDERQIVARVAIVALSNLGYTVRAHGGSRSTGVWAQRGDQILGVLVHDGGAFETDTVGLAGDACRPVLAEFTRELKRNGVDAHETGRSYHGDRRGGQIVARAAKVVRDGDFARALVQQHELGVTRVARRTPATVGAANVRVAR